MQPIPTSAFIAKAKRLAVDPSTDRFSTLYGEVVMRGPGRCWRSIEWCAKCEEDFDPEGHVFHDEINNLAYCENCVEHG